MTGSRYGALPGTSRSSRPARQRARERTRARQHHARVRRRKATRNERRALAAAAFAAAFLVGVLAGSHDATFWLTLGGGAEGGVEHVSVVGHHELAADDVVARSGIEPGTPVAAIDPEATAQRVADHAWVRRAHVRLAGDDTVWIAVEEREPVAAIEGPRPGAWRVAEADGTPFATLEPGTHPELLRLEGGAALASGEPQPVVAEALALADSIERVGLPRPEALTLPAADDDEPALGWRFRLASDGPEVVLGVGPYAHRLARLAELIAARPAEVRSAERIDLRFRDRAILRTADTIPAEEVSDAASSGTDDGTSLARLGGLPASG